MQALRDDPGAPNAATPRQAWAVVALVAAVFITFLVAWTFLGLPAPVVLQ